MPNKGSILSKNIYLITEVWPDWQLCHVIVSSCVYEIITNCFKDLAGFFTKAAAWLGYLHLMFELQPFGMAILYSVIARGQTVLAKYASCAGNFQEVAEQILAKIPEKDAKLTYSHGKYVLALITYLLNLCVTSLILTKTYL